MENRAISLWRLPDFIFTDNVCAEEGSRTPTPLRASDFESPVSAIPPLRRERYYNGYTLVAVNLCSQIALAL